MNNPTTDRNYHKPIPPEQYHELAKSRGLEWIGEYPGSIQRNTTWRCSKGHIWEGRYSNVLHSKYGCLICSYEQRGRNRRLNASDYITLAFSRNFEWIGIEIPNAVTKTLWKCAYGHEFESVYYALKTGNGCPVCRDEKRRASPYHIVRPEQYLELAEQRQFVFLGITRTRNKLKGHWRCQEGHEWLAIYAKVKDGQGCPRCAKLHQNDSRRTLPEKYTELASTRSFEWIGEWPQSVHRKTRWRCSLGHEWDATYSHVAGGRGCPTCVDIVNGHRVSTPQRELHTLLGGELNFRAGRYAIDVALIVDGVQIAVEYDCWYWHQGNARHERKRDAFLIKYGWRILHIRTNFQFPEQEQLDAGIVELIDGALTAEIRLDWGGT